MLPTRASNIPTGMFCCQKDMAHKRCTSTFDLAQMSSCGYPKSSTNNCTYTSSFFIL